MYNLFLAIHVDKLEVILEHITSKQLDFLKVLEFNKKIMEYIEKGRVSDL